MWRAVLLFVIVGLVGIAGGWGVRHMYRFLNPPPAPPAAQSPLVFAEPPSSETSSSAKAEKVGHERKAKGELLRAGDLEREEQEPEPIYCTGVSLRSGEVVVQWSDGSRQSAQDFVLAGQRLRLTSTAVWVDDERFPVMEHRPATVRAGDPVGAATVASTSAVGPVVPLATAGAAQAGGDDPTWSYSWSTGAWYLRDRSATIGAPSR